MNIGLASQASGVSQRMIRHYDTIGRIPAPARGDSGSRDYAEADVHRLCFIANARDLGIPIDDIRQSMDVKQLALARAEELHRKALLDLA